MSTLRVYLIFETTHCILNKEIYILFSFLFNIQYREVRSAKINNIDSSTGSTNNDSGINDSSSICSIVTDNISFDAVLKLVALVVVALTEATLTVSRIDT